jgi:hypothetical protein
MHRMADLDAGRESVEDESPRLAAQDRDEIGEVLELRRGMDRRGELSPSERAS